MPWKSLSREAWTFLFARGLSAFSLGIVVILLNLYFRAVGFDEKFMGLSFAIFGLGCALSSIPVGFLSDYIGSLRTMIIGEVILCLTLWGQVSFFSSHIILLSSLVAGIGTAFIAVSRQPYTAKVSKKTDKVSLFSFSYAVFLGMSVVGNVFGGFARRLIPALSIATSYRYLLFVAGVLNLLSAAILYFTGKMRAKTTIGDSESEDAPSVEINGTIGNTKPKNRISLWIDVIKFGAIRLIIGLGSGLSIPFLNIYFKDRFELSTLAIGVVFGVGSLVTAVIVMGGPPMAKRSGTVNTIVFLQIISLPFLVVLSVSQLLALAIIAFWLRASLMKTSTPLFRSVVMNSLPKHFRGRGASVTVTLWHLGHAGGSLAGGRLIADTGFFAPFVLTAGIYGFGAMLFYLMFHKVKQEKVP